MSIKKITFSLAMTCVMMTLNIKAQIPNGGFESWTPDLDGLLYPTGWVTTNAYPDTSIEQYTPAYLGNFSMLVKSWDTGFGILGGAAQLEFPYSQRPTHMNACVKSFIVPGDTAFIIVSMRQGDSIVAAPLNCTFKIGATMNSFTCLTFPISYVSSLTPDTANIIVTSELGFGAHLGTYIVVDELSFSFTAGIDEPINSGASLGQIFPNPVSVSTAVSLTLGSASEISLSLFDILGKCVRETGYGWMPAGEHVLDVSVADLPAGVYQCAVSGNDFHNSKKLIVAK